MPDSIMYREDCFVFLEADREEEFLSREESIAKLTAIVREDDRDLPREISKITEFDRKVEYLLDNYCEFDRGDGKYLQWYAVRLEK